MRRVTGVLLSLVVVVLGLLPVMAPAQAEGHGMPGLRQPADGSLMPWYWRSLSLRLDETTREGDYRMELACDTGSAVWDFTLLRGTGIPSLVSPVALHGDCRATLTRVADGQVATWTFRVVGPVITTPTENDVYPRGWRGPITLNTSELFVGRYGVSLDCPTGGHQVWWIDKVENTTTHTIESPIPLGGSCDMTFASEGASYALDTRRFVVDPLRVSTLVDGGPFYPRVRDGYLDTMSVAYSVNRPVEEATITISSSDRQVVRHASLGPIASAGQRTWTWDGRDDAGNVVAPGEYSVQFEARADEMRATSYVATTTVATKTAWARRSVSKTGGSGTAARRGACWVGIAANRSHSALLCRGGEYARMSYGFTIPASARNITFGVAGGWTALDRCCKGTLRRWSARHSETHYRVHARVNGTRSYRVNRVTIAYEYLRTY